MENLPRIRRAQSCRINALEAVQEFHTAVAQPDMALVIFFCSSTYDLELLAREMKRLFGGVQVVGCTTAGEIGPSGYQDNSLTGASFPASSFTAVSGHIDHLQQFEADRGQTFVQELLQKLEVQAPHATTLNSFGLLLTDGLSMREEPVTRALQSALGKCPLVGGSAGDGVSFGCTRVYSEGCFHIDSAVLTLVTTPLPFRLFKTQHFVATDERLVVTEADASHRVVKEINGWPATTEYARILGVDASHLGPASFAASPVVVRIDSTNYVRSVQSVNPDGSLTFFCAIEDGLVFRVAKGVNLLENLEQAFTRIREEIGTPQLVLACECILRKLEIFQSPSKDLIDAVYRQNNTVGFHTYGEQFQGVHVNQTLVGIAIGADAMRIDDV
ncbi:nitric oxide-sensing protein NosP [Rhodoferax sp.]|uniref:nitric oxide-sensing protein NosP n=1 Tax=Rhodoferax sp. TaxID=50421 RepID=UPI0028466C70|nr:nitric oxide-sensing protein NosP [Rhodoferax sp.]MDR3370180.1 nitric oxide-sensing protein NosP [Rhodoferax sp.]